MCSWAHSITRKLHYTGIIQADWIVDENKAWLLEINPRWTASMEIIEWATGQNLFSIQAGFDDELKTMISGAAAKTSRPFPAQTLYKAIQYASTPLVVSREQSDEMLLNKFNRFEKQGTSLSNFVGWGDIPQVGTAISAGHPIASFFKVQ